MNQDLNMTKADRIKGGIFGHLIGDALGVPYEFMMRGSFNCTDTVAAVAGGLAGIYYGYNNIPQEWINQLARKEEIELLVNQFISAYED